MNDEVKKLLNDLADMTCPIFRETGTSCLDNKVQSNFRCMSCRSKVLLKERVIFSEGPGRAIFRNGQAWIVIQRDADLRNTPTPHQTDLLTKRIIHLLNTYGEE